MVSIATEPVVVTKTAITHLSWSKIQAYLMCPRQLAFRLEEAPRERVSAALIFGGAIHAASELIHEARLAGAALPAVSDLLNAYDRAWKEREKAEPPIEFAKTENVESLRELAERMLDAYLVFVQSRPNSEVIAIEHESDFLLLPDVPPFKVRLDLLERVGDELHVSDLKTARSLWNDDKVSEHLPQVIAYSMAAAGIARQLGLRIVPEFVVVTKAKSPKVQVLTPSASQEDVARLRNLVADVWKGIQSGTFPARIGWQCKGCAYRDRCKKETGCW